MVTLLKPEHQDARLRELEADTTESGLRMIRAKRPVMERHGYKIGLEVLTVA